MTCMSGTVRAHQRPKPVTHLADMDSPHWTTACGEDVLDVEAVTDYPPIVTCEACLEVTSNADYEGQPNPTASDPTPCDYCTIACRVCWFEPSTLPPIDSSGTA